MLFPGVVNEEADPLLRESLLQRLEIISHKIRFMEAVPVAVLESDNTLNFRLYDAVKLAGGSEPADVQDAVYLIWSERGKGLPDLMREIAPHLEPSFQAVANSRVLLVEEDAYDPGDAESFVSLVEDLAEMLHPGSFIFGHEGIKWLRYAV